MGKGKISDYAFNIRLKEANKCALFTEKEEYTDKQKVQIKKHNDHVPLEILLQSAQAMLHTEASKDLLKTYIENAKIWWQMDTTCTLSVLANFATSLNGFAQDKLYDVKKEVMADLHIVLALASQGLDENDEGLPVMQTLKKAVSFTTFDPETPIDQLPASSLMKTYMSSFVQANQNKELKEEVVKEQDVAQGVQDDALTHSLTQVIKDLHVSKNPIALVLDVVLNNISGVKLPNTVTDKLKGQVIEKSTAVQKYDMSEWPSDNNNDLMGATDDMIAD